MEVDRDGRTWRIGTAEEVAWLAGRPAGRSVVTSMPQVFDWDDVLVEGGPAEALRWRYGHMRSGEGHLPDLCFPFDRSWFVTALWDDAFSCIGASREVIDALAEEPLAGLRRVRPTDEDVTPPGAPRD